MTTPSDSMWKRDPSVPRDPSALPRRFALLLLFVFLAVLIRTAWISDDGMISLRTVMNVTHGYGLTQNVAERVQTFTHPLWMLLLTAAYLAVGNVYYATFALAIVVSLVAIWIALRRTSSREQSIIVALAMVGSRAFIDFATSGLENPLSYVLLAAFAGVFLAERGPRRRWLTRLVLLSSLLYLTRPDEILIVLPLIIVAAWRTRAIGTIAGAVAVGVLPAVAWTMFSLVYYGFPFPNTAYAKLGSGIAQSEMWRQGLLYLIDSLDRDPLTLVFVGFALVLGIAERSAASRALAAGIALYVVYVTRIGGDFMAGRFLAVPFFGAVLLVGRFVANTRGFWVATGLALAMVGAASAGPPLKSDSRFDQRMAKNSGIVDERAFYIKTNSLLYASRESFVQPEWELQRTDLDGAWNVLDTCGLMGTAGLEWGPNSHLMDECALADPLLARLPAVFNEAWRTGHYRRAVPAGYRESLQTSGNEIADARLSHYYAKLRLIVRGRKLFSKARLETIAQMNLGAFDHLIDFDRYRYGGTIRTLTDMTQVKADQTPWDAPGVVSVVQAPLVIRVEDRPGRRYLDVSLDSNDEYRILFLKQYTRVAHLDVGPIPRQRRGPGLASYTVNLPARATREGFDTITVTTRTGDDRAYSVGHFLLDGYAQTDAELQKRVAARDKQ
jgi:arabinofuranosyltransferase